MGQFTTLFKKNFLMWRRDTCCCACQIITVIVFAFIMVAIKGLSASSAVTKSPTTYLNKPQLGGDVPMPFPILSNQTITSDTDIVNTYAAMGNTKRGESRSFFKDCNYNGDQAGQRKGGFVARSSRCQSEVLRQRTLHQHKQRPDRHLHHLPHAGHLPRLHLPHAQREGNEGHREHAQHGHVLAAPLPLLVRASTPSCCSSARSSSPIIVKATFFSYSNFILRLAALLPARPVLLSLAFVICSFFVTAKPGVLTGIISFFLLYAVTIGRS
jgi:hypothetical protein